MVIPSRILSVVPLHEKTPVALLYWITPEPKRLVRSILLLKVSQSVAERAPVVVPLARRREIS